jgi:hypothetical protein
MPGWGGIGPVAWRRWRIGHTRRPVALSAMTPDLPQRVPHVQRVISSNGALTVAGAKLHVGHAHRGKIVIVALEDTQFRILHQGQELAVHPRTVIKEVNRLRASGHIDYEL